VNPENDSCWGMVKLYQAQQTEGGLLFAFRHMNINNY